MPLWIWFDFTWGKRRCLRSSFCLNSVVRKVYNRILLFYGLDWLVAFHYCILLILAYVRIRAAVVKRFRKVFNQASSDV